MNVVLEYHMSYLVLVVRKVHSRWWSDTNECCLHPLEETKHGRSTRDRQNDGSEVDMTSAIDALWIRFRSLVIATKRALKSRVCEITYSTMTSMYPPPEKSKPMEEWRRKERNQWDMMFIKTLYIMRMLIKCTWVPKNHQRGHVHNSLNLLISSKKKPSHNQLMF